MSARPLAGVLTAAGIAAVFGVMLVAAWLLGRQEGSESEASGGYDLGVAATPSATGVVREFALVAQEAPWEIAPGVTVPAVTYNNEVPGPLIRVTEGDTIRVTLKNELSQATSIHWHGLHVPNAMDGVPPFTQAPVEPGETFVYEFPASHAGTFMYHPHTNAVEQIDRGLYAPLIIDQKQRSETRFDKEFVMVLSAWNALSATDGEDGRMMPMPGMNMNYNYFTINGKSFPLAPEWLVETGDVVRVRLINISNLAHPMHLHGQDFTVVAKDGEPIRSVSQLTMNTLSIDAGETYDIVFRADNPGTWLFHCHELHHTENDGVEPGGLMQVIRHAGSPGPATAPGQTATPMPAKMPGMQH